MQGTLGCNDSLIAW